MMPGGKDGEKSKIYSSFLSLRTHFLFERLFDPNAYFFPFFRPSVGIIA